MARESEGLHGAGHPSPCDEASRTQPDRTEECLAGGSNAVAASARKGDLKSQKQSDYSIQLSREETLKSVQRAASLFWHALSPTQKGVIKGLMERLYAPCEDKNLFKDLIKHCIE
ncbi:Coiled-coil domain-containing protein 7 [Frankliniella fusca]|uniref:Coiled-coil domain-containing protein 7 n=1 Tax=Frankliniella fusca TaxID=407009 RepID=A0AAE1HN16_9NEOP|nr:Coiled-coil domain-containing protein 7 [Frankliniella fusca]